MSTHQEKARLTIECSMDEKMYIKMLAAKHHQTISEYFLSFVRSKIPSKTKTREPNKETKKAMMDSRRKKNLGHAKTVEEFWASMGIDPNA